MILQKYLGTGEENKILIKKDRNDLASRQIKIKQVRNYIPQKQYTIFCVDNSPIVQFWLKNFLSQADYRVVINSDPLKSCAMLLNMKQVDAIVVDIMMPQMAG